MSSDAPNSLATRRPVPVTVIGCVFIVAGVVGLAYHAGDVRTLRPAEYALVCFVRLLAIVGGVFLLRGQNWARWLVLAWMAFHVALSVMHTPAELIMHAILLAVIAFFLFRPKASAYFRPARAEAV
jgi:hypothetical protein